ncbi:MAG: hypothetical protein RIT81_04290 [Deltaproteobacteria bacterium]
MTTRTGTAGQAGAGFLQIRISVPTADAKRTTPAAPVHGESATAQVTGRDLARQAPTDRAAGGPSSIVAVRSGDTAPQKVKSIRFAKYDGPAVAYPLTAEGRATLKSCDADSPRVASDPEVRMHPTELTPPTHPGDKGYWAELEKVVDVQLKRLEGGQVEDVLGDRVPKLFEGYTLSEAAEAVHTDLPGDWPTALFRQFLSEGAKFDASVVPHHSANEFVNTKPLTNGVLNMATSIVSPSAFACKWHHGRARPEETVWAIANNKLKGVPPALKAKVDALDLATQNAFTAYPEGCPKHPSWPAMHSAASISSMVLAVMFDLNPEQLTEARNLDYAVATFRTVAGVHFESDNIAGLQIGQKVIEDWLPGFLQDCAGADPDAVRAKIAKIKYDWDQHPSL